MAKLMHPKRYSLGAVGTGMSMYCKLESEQIQRMMKTIDIIVIDPEREWQKLIKESRQRGNENGEANVSEKR